MAVEREPINPRAWIDYIEAGRDHFERVRRSFNVFGRNAHELYVLLRRAETDPVLSMRLMEVTGPEDVEGARFRDEFWEQLDQRLHNMVSAAVTVVDHTRPLVAFYPHAPAFVTEWDARSAEVAKSPRAQFLRKLRNYLLHHGVAPLMQSMTLGPSEAGQWDNLTIMLSADELLRYSDWNAAHRDYIRGFDGGPPLRRITQEYADAMKALYGWLFEQYEVLHPVGVPPPHLYPRRGGPPGEQ